MWRDMKDVVKGLARTFRFEQTNLSQARLAAVFRMSETYLLRVI